MLSVWPLNFDKRYNISCFIEKVYMHWRWGIKRHFREASCRTRTRREVRALSSSCRAWKSCRQGPSVPCTARPRSPRWGSRQAGKKSFEITIDWFDIDRIKNHLNYNKLISQSRGYWAISCLELFYYTRQSNEIKKNIVVIILTW